MNCLEKPEGLSELGGKAYDSIIEFLKANELTDTGGCKVFYSPKQWREKGERYGIGSELIICYDGGDHARAFAYAYEAYSTMEALSNHLQPLGVFCEQCTGWYSAIYKE